MPCFSPPPEPGTPGYAEWLPETERRLSAFKHVVDYYYQRAGFPMPEPEPGAPHGPRGTMDGDELPFAPSQPVDLVENRRVLEQILLHLDCDGVTFIHLYDLSFLLHEDQTPQGRGYQFVRAFCFRAMRHGVLERPTSTALWLASEQPWHMLECLGAASPRKLRLFAVACCRRVPELLTDERSKRAVEAAELFAEGQLSVEDLARAEKRARRAGSNGRAATFAADPDARQAAWHTSWEAANGHDDSSEHQAQAALVREFFGNPFRPAAFAPEWRTDTVLSLASQMYESRDFTAMPILADALQDAGCNNADVLTHLRDATAAHLRGCWVLDLVLGKS